MAGPESVRRSGRKSKGKQQQAKRRPNQTGNAQANAPNTKERTITQLPKLEREQNLEKMPSNSPTMAIAPSDYEHIFHEATGVIAQPREPPPAQQQARPTGFKPTAPVSPPPNLVQVSPPPPNQPLPSRYPRSPEAANNGLGAGPSNTRSPADVLMVSPDGYTILGQQPPPEGAGHRRVALPAYIVRASNQFSRAALSRVARYLASRADPQR